MNELEQLLEATGNDIGEVMAELRGRLRAARKMDNEEAAAAAELLYLEAAGIQHARNKIVIARIGDSDELRALMEALRASNKELTKNMADIAVLVKQIGTLRKALAGIESTVKSIAALAA